VISDELRAELREELHRRCDAMDWTNMGASAKALQYGNWVDDPTIGGRLEPFLEGKGRIRVYIKDTLLKSYHRSKQSGARIPLLHLGLDPSTAYLRTYEKPHGLLLAGNRVVCWGRAADWKNVLMAAFERAFEVDEQPYGAVLLEPSARFAGGADRDMVEEAAKRLQIYDLRWVE
jgi:hypothetical protein